MASAGTRVEESTHVPGRSADELSNTIRSVIEVLPHHQCATVGHGIHKLVRSYRLPLRLLRTHTDVCTITVVDAPLGAVVTAVGALTPEARAAVKGVLAGATVGRVMSAGPQLATNYSSGPLPTPVAVASAGSAAGFSTAGSCPPATVASPGLPSDLTTVRPRPTPAADMNDMTTVRPRAPAQDAPTPVDLVAATPRLRFDSGQVVEIGPRVVVVGRNPLALAADGHALTVAVPDPGHTVSKTHFACGRNDRGIWLEDRHSTNGTSVADAKGRRASLVPGRRTLVPVSVTVIFGDHRAVLEVRS